MSKLLILSLLLLATTLASSTRFLNEVPDLLPSPDTAIPIPVEPPFITAAPTTNAAVEPIPIDHAPIIAPVSELPDSDAPPLTTPTATAAVTPTPEEPAPVVAHVPDTDAPPLTTPTATAAVTPTPEEPAPVVAPVPDTDAPPLTTPVAANSAAAPVADKPAPVAAPVTGDGSPTFSFFMHDILGGSHPSGRAVAGIVASSAANNLPFSKTNNQIFPINGGVPLNTVNGVVNNNNLPFLVGLNGSPSSTLVQNNGNNAATVSGGGNQPFVTAGQLPAGLTLQQLTFGSVTVVDNEITEGHELGSAVMGRAQGFYLTSSSDGSSHSLVLTAIFHGGEHGGEIIDTLNFFGVHRTAAPISDIAIVGGTGKYENAKGFAAIETLPHVDQHTTDGVETITHFTIRLTP